ncbi:GntR family transcriptional regulator [Actinokineospora auranticolor]|uniref:DNA-binding GntR family transcriptional regulator n=1 Tax=Actinokineospora auranticolor TaxID=155976 RepID=A0A2S6GL85_9PSEU|nr:GntR family transcriptional regulator [Actinokineospora auranticolor]PPK65916.1 DNA-binding GntR family transcriptional regulator [Actinokineospora auranticolor]
MRAGRLGERLAGLVQPQRSAAELAAASLREAIMLGELLPGERVAEEDLLRPLGISRNTLREAFRLLAHEKLLEHQFNRGVFVRTVDANDVEDLFRVRRLIEVPALANSTTEDWSTMTEAVQTGLTAATRGEWTEVGTANIRFHQAIVAAAGSRRLDELMCQLTAELRLAFHGMGDPRTFHESYLHRNNEIATLTANGDLARATTLLTTYLDDAEREMTTAFRAAGRGCPQA